MKTITRVTIDGRRLDLSNLDKPLYPTGFTKGDVIEYYTHIAPVMLRHLRHRPITLKRYPDGAESTHFFEKNCPAYKPDWMPTADVQYAEGGRHTRHCLINNRAALIWAANLASLELHTSLATTSDINRPTAIAFDLDPGEPANLLDCLDVALDLRQAFDHLGLACFAKTSGGKGLHLFLPLNTPVTYGDTKPFAHAIAQLMEQRRPDRVTHNMSKAARSGKVFIDWSQNTPHKTTVCVYSLRARPEPTVSTPVTWDEIAAARRRRDPDRLKFLAPEAIARVQQHGDLFEDVLTLKQKLPRIEPVE
jgi:bifunctional non-homologous end joining protein LigD